MVVLEKTLESSLNCKRRSNQSILMEITLNTHWKGWCWSWSSNILATWYEHPTRWKKNPEAGKDWRQKEKSMTEDEMVGWHHWLSWHELGQTRGDGEGKGSPECCSPWDQEESDKTRLLNNNTIHIYLLYNQWILSSFQKCFKTIK